MIFRNVFGLLLTASKAEDAACALQTLQGFPMLLMQIIEGGSLTSDAQCDE